MSGDPQQHQVRRGSDTAAADKWRPAARALLALCAAGVAITATAAPASPSGRLSAEPAVAAPVATALRPGLTSFGAGAALYVPPTISAHRDPPPLLLLFPGTGGNGRAMITDLTGYADRGRFLLLAFTPRGENFDSVDFFFDDYEARRESALRTWPEPRFGFDRANVNAALARLFAETAVDRARIGLLGFSHGASYALSLGTANPQLFASVQALSPGLLVIDAAAKGGQSIFLAHGRRDEVQPYRRTANAMVPRLQSLGYRVQFAPFDGAHTVPGETLAAAIAHFLNAPALRHASATKLLRPGKRRLLPRAVDHFRSLGACAATIDSKRGSLRSGSHIGSSLRLP